MGPLTLAVVLYLLILGAYILVGFGRVVSSVLLLSYVPGYRAIIGIGIASVILTGLYLSHESTSRKSLGLGLGVIVAAFVGFVGFAYLFGAHYASATFTLDWARALPVCIALALAVGALVFRARTSFFVVMLALVVIPSWGTIPVSASLKPIYDKALVKQVQGVLRADPAGRWLVYGNSLTPEIVRAAGADVFNGTRFPPEVSTLRRLDPTGRSRFTWNRYAHISCLPGQPGAVVFRLLKVPKRLSTAPADLRREMAELIPRDAYEIVINPGNPVLAASGIRYFVAKPRWQTYFPAAQFRRLTPVPADGYYIFEGRNP